MSSWVPAQSSQSDEEKAGIKKATTG